MNFKRDLLLGVGALVAILLLVCFGSIGLFARMSPAIEHVLQENDVSLAATEEMLVVLALERADEAPAARKARFEAALERVRSNVTEKDEEPEIEMVVGFYGLALEGDAAARVKTVEALQRLAHINRAAMHHANDNVQRLGWAGAWATVILCLVGFTAALVVTRRLDRRVAHPIANLVGTLEAALAGDVHRRCVPSGARNEVWFLMQAVNTLLDRCSSEQPVVDSLDGRLRAPLLHLMDEGERLRVLLDESGRIVAASRHALDRLDGSDAAKVRSSLDRCLTGEVSEPILEMVEVGDGMRLCTLAQDG